MNLKIRYFASLREKAGKSFEENSFEVATAQELYEVLNQKYAFDMKEENLRVSVNGCYSDFDTALRAGDEVVFIPPVAGG